MLKPAGSTSTYMQLMQGCCLGRLSSATVLIGPAVLGRAPWQDQLEGTCQQPSCRYHCTITQPAWTDTVMQDTGCDHTADTWGCRRAKWNTSCPRNDGRPYNGADLRHAPLDPSCL